LTVAAETAAAMTSDVMLTALEPAAGRPFSRATGAGDLAGELQMILNKQVVEL
jgi:hypothetical protein